MEELKTKIQKVQWQMTDILDDLTALSKEKLGYKYEGIKEAESYWKDCLDWLVGSLNDIESPDEDDEE